MTRHPAPSLQLLFHVALGATTAVALCASPGRAQSGSRTTPPDSSLVGRILMAEDRRDSLDAALVEGTHSVDPVVRSLAVRALRRITDPKFVARTSLSPLPAPPAYPEPAWRLRLRALAAVRDDCGALRLALADSAKPVRLRAADLVGASCAGDSIVIATLRGWVDALPSRPDGPTRTTVSWQAAAHALVALGRLSPAQARPRITRLGAHGSWHVRQYAARAAGGVADTALLRRLARDPDDNVAEAAIEQLARLVGHEADLLYLAALRRNGAQVVRAAAVALKDSPRADAAPAARAAFERFVAHDNASARDARVALLAAAGLPASADRPPMTRLSLSAAERADAVGLALGADVRLRVTLDAAAGGGSFTVRLRGDVAPLMGARLLALARRGYYDGLTWHRVEHDFVIQGGSPAASEYVGADRYLRDEL
ncbi:MAG: peptidylprolyl isomerase, partial [Gemmatimonadota bacterium]|nr:peptidylprolyl isomerase [Gemmatimonadota bacterium]